jgi:tetratricopeptide (TPR) repeat protein
VWAPGKAPARATDGSAWRLDAHTDLVLQLHMQRTGRSERVAPEIGLFFSDKPPTKRRYSVRIGDLPIDIAPGERDYHMTDSYVLPADVRILSMFPHAHYVAKKLRVWSHLPDGRELELLRIDDWDFNWQDEYTFVDAPLLPRGSTLQMQFSYDNSAGNPRNPNRPPRRVRDGKQSTDEMGNVTFQALPARAQDLDVLLESKYRRQLARGRSAEMLYNLGNTLSRLGKNADAIEQYRAALELEPKLEPAHFNLAGALLAQGAAEQALPELEAALSIAPDDLDARLTLGQTLQQLGRSPDALAQYERAVASDPNSAAAHVLLGDALRARGDARTARAHYNEALRLRPDWPPARDGLNALASTKAPAR